jgi:hypothetical protein
MPKQMFLKSAPSASSISAPVPGYRLHDFHALADDEPIPNDLFVRYGLWFQETLVPHVEEEQVAAIRRNPRCPPARPG